MCHGNEPGTLKEVVSLNNTGPCAPLTGAFTVLIELGPAAFTGSLVDMNKAPTPGVGSNASGAGGGGGGGGAGAGSAGAGGGPSGPSGPAGGGGGAGGSSSAAAPLKGVSQHELDLAAKPGNTKEQIKAREKVAKRFYKQQGGMDAKEARNHMRGIDFDKPLTIGPPPPIPSPQACFQNPGGNPNRPGQYFAQPGATPDSLGIASKGNAFGPPPGNQYGAGPMGPKQATNYNMDPNTTYMQSTAAPVKDTWSAPGHSYGTDGGGTQNYVPRNGTAAQPPGSTGPAPQNPPPQVAPTTPGS